MKLSFYKDQDGDLGFGKKGSGIAHVVINRELVGTEMGPSLATWDQLITNQEEAVNSELVMALGGYPVEELTAISEEEAKEIFKSVGGEV